MATSCENDHTRRPHLSLFSLSSVSFFYLFLLSTVNRRCLLTLVVLEPVLLSLLQHRSLWAQFIASSKQFDASALCAFQKVFFILRAPMSIVRERARDADSAGAKVGAKLLLYCITLNSTSSTPQSVWKRSFSISKRNLINTLDGIRYQVVQRQEKNR